MRRAILFAAALAAGTSACLFEEPPTICADIAPAFKPGVLSPPATGTAPANTLVWLQTNFSPGVAQLVGFGETVLLRKVPVTSGANTRGATRFRPERPLQPGRWTVRVFRGFDGMTETLGEFSVDARTDEAPPGVMQLESVEVAAGGSCGGDVIDLQLSNAQDDSTAAGHMLHEIFVANEAGTQDLSHPTVILMPGERSFAMAMEDVSYLKIRAMDAAGNVGPFGEEWRVIVDHQSSLACSGGGALGPWAALAALALLRRRRT